MLRAKGIEFEINLTIVRKSDMTQSAHDCQTQVISMFLKEHYEISID